MKNYTKTKHLVAYGIILALIAAFLSNDLYMPSMPVLVDWFSTTDNHIQSTVTAWFLGSMMLQLILGPLSDIYGRKRILLLSIVILIIGCLFSIFAPSLFWFMAGRVLQGLAAAGIMVTAYAAIHEQYTDEKEAAKMLGYVGAGSALAPAAGPLIGGYVFVLFNWQANFWLVILLGIICFFLLNQLMPKTSEEPVQKKINWRQLFYNYGQLLSNVKFTTTVLCYALIFFSGGAFLTAIAFIVVDILGYTPEQVGWFISPVLVLYIFAAAITGHVGNYWAPRKFITVALVILSLLMLIFVVSSIWMTVQSASILLFVGAFYFSGGLLGPHLNNASLSCASSDNKGAASALLTTGMMAAATLGSSLMSLFYNDTVWVLAVLMAVGIWGALISYWIYIYKAK